MMRKFNKPQNDEPTATTRESTPRPAFGRPAPTATSGATADRPAARPTAGQVGGEASSVPTPSFGRSFRSPTTSAAPAPDVNFEELKSASKSETEDQGFSASGASFNLEKINNILTYAIEQKASDVIITAYTEPVLKIYGQTTRVAQFGIVSTDDIERFKNDIMNEEQRATLERDFQIDFSFESDGFRWRVNIAGQRNSHFMTMRIIPTEIRTIEELRLPNKLIEICKRPRGLVLVTGPTGSGKSTSLAAMIHHINTNMSRHIVTIEDPIEFMHPNLSSVVNQREIGSDAKSFKAALRSVLRQAPDVILVGELRDHETMEAAISAAETGHLVMATLHTNSAVGTVDRIIDAFPEGARGQVRNQLANNLICVMSQTLVPRADGQGRVLAYELMLQHTAITSAIQSGTTNGIYDTINANEREGMMSLDKMLERLYKERVITEQVALSLAINSKEMQISLRGKS